MVVIYIFVLGMIFGSFYNVVALRRPKEESIVYPPSHCPNCNQFLKWYDLLPVISFLLCLGKCRYCKKRISLIYPLMEIVTGSLFLLAYLKYGISYEFFAFCIISSLMLIIFVSDFKYMIILDGPLAIATISLLILKWIYFDFKVMLLSLISGFLILLFLYFVRLLGNYLFKRESLGGGDVKLGFFMGSALALKLGFISLMLACFLTFPYAIYISFKNKEDVIPFGPFLIMSVAIVFLFMDWFIALIKMFSVI